LTTIFLLNLLKQEMTTQIYMHNNRSPKCLAPLTNHARSEEWKPVTVIETKKILWFVFCNWYSPKTKLELYWSMRGIFQNTIFPQTMSRNRFQLIQRYLHFHDNNAVGTNEDTRIRCCIITVTFIIP